MSRQGRRALYTITTDSDRKLVTIKITGLISTREVEQLYREEHAAIRRMGCWLGDHYALVDLTECKLQLQDVAAAFQQQMSSSAKAKRLALFTGSSLSRMQVRRITQRDNAQIFATQEEAENWLFNADDLSAAA